MNTFAPFCSTKRLFLLYFEAIGCATIATIVIPYISRTLFLFYSKSILKCALSQEPFSKDQNWVKTQKKVLRRASWSWQRAVSLTIGGKREMTVVKVHVIRTAAAVRKMNASVVLLIFVRFSFHSPRGSSDYFGLVSPFFLIGVEGNLIPVTKKNSVCFEKNKYRHPSCWQRINSNCRAL